MGSRPFPEISCTLCSKPMDLRIDLCADENGKAIHEDCYVKRMSSENYKLNAGETLPPSNRPVACHSLFRSEDFSLLCTRAAPPSRRSIRGGNNGCFFQPTIFHNRGDYERKTECHHVGSSGKNY